MISIRPATRADALAFWGRLPPMSFRGLAAVDETGGIVGMAGYYLASGVAVLWTDHRDGMRPRDILRGAAAVVDLTRRLGIEVVALVEGDAEERAARHFGFEPAGRLWRLAS